MNSRVAVLRLAEDRRVSLERTLDLIGGIRELNRGKRDVVVKVGVFTPKQEFHTSIDVLGAIVNSFNKAPKICLVESDNYRGTGSERLQVWKQLFSKRVVPFNLSEDSDTKQFVIAGEKIALSHILFKPNVLVSTHILRKSEETSLISASVLKNLLGLVPDSKKARFHKKLPTALADMFEAVGGIDLAVIDGTRLWLEPEFLPVQANTVLVGTDAVAVDVVGAALAGMNPEKVPIIQEFVRRGLGEGDLKRIETVGADFESLRQELASARRIRKRKPRAKGPSTWGGRTNAAFRSLMEEGFFRFPNNRTMEDVVKALEGKSIPARGQEKKVAGFLARRVKSGVLKKSRVKDEWVYSCE